MYKKIKIFNILKWGLIVFVTNCFLMPIKAYSQIWDPIDKDPYILKALKKNFSENEEIIGVRNLNSKPVLLILVKNSIKKTGFVYEAIIIQMSLDETINDNEASTAINILCDCNNSKVKIVQILIDRNWKSGSEANWLIAIGDSVASRMLNSVCSKL